MQRGLRSYPTREFRTTLLLDMTSAHRSLVNGEWKAAAVLAGSVAEASLAGRSGARRQPELVGATISADLKHQQQRTAAEGQSRSIRDRFQNSGGGVEFRRELIGVAEAAEVITPDTGGSCKLGPGHRNLIRPGLSLRSGANL